MIHSGFRLVTSQPRKGTPGTLNAPTVEEVKAKVSRPAVPGVSGLNVSPSSSPLIHILHLLTGSCLDLTLSHEWDFLRLEKTYPRGPFSTFP